MIIVKQLNMNNMLVIFKFIKSDFFNCKFVSIIFCFCFLIFPIKNYAQLKADSVSVNRKFVLSAQCAFNSYTLIYFLPMTQGISLGINLEREIVTGHYVGFDHLLGQTINLFESVHYLQLATTQLYYYRNSFKCNIINQFGLSNTTFEFLDYTDYRNYGDRFNAVGLIIGNNNIHIFRNQPKIKLGIQCSLPIYIYGFSNYGSDKYWIADFNDVFPYSFTYISLKYMLTRF